MMWKTCLQNSTIHTPSLWLQHSAISPERVQDREADGFKHRVRSSKIIEEHDKEAMIRKLMKVAMSVLMVLDQHMRHCHQLQQAS